MSVQREMKVTEVCRKTEQEPAEHKRCVVSDEQDHCIQGEPEALSPMPTINIELLFYNPIS